MCYSEATSTYAFSTSTILFDVTNVTSYVQSEFSGS